MLLFVYGTLLRGLERNTLLADSVFKGTGTIRAILYDCGSYPGIREGAGLVCGELYEINRETLQLLDQVEGYREENSTSLFVRQDVEVTIAEGTVSAICYFFNHSTDALALISSGDYLLYRQTGQ